MNPTAFFPFHNKHIRFKIINGNEMSGVLVDQMNGSSVYRFIPTRNMVEWQLAQKNEDEVKMKSLESNLDILTIEWAERIRY